ncbi:hypothetical protein [Stackebrandtia soli]|uniref:hypothetical protein n=1 Tax=Stackebrandtia soli TaxID=1892856 RepID=UPI0039EAFAF8
MSEAPPTRYLNLTIAEEPITAATTKIGGQPNWVDTPQWPTSKESGELMEFIGQFRLPSDETRMAYLFMTGEGNPTSWESEAGENALIVQGPGSRLPAFLTVTDDAKGPTVGPDVTVRLSEQPDSHGLNYMGGRPAWIQSDETPGDDWIFLFQLADGDTGYSVNFGDAGIGYGFVKSDLSEGRFLWQCS